MLDKSETEKSVICGCGTNKINKSCLLKMCKECCGKSLARCFVSGHREAKGTFLKTPVTDIITEAISKGLIVWIKYLGGKSPGSIRSIKPLHWVIPCASFKAKCFNSDIEKRYNMDKVADVRYEIWSDDNFK